MTRTAAAFTMLWLATTLSRGVEIAGVKVADTVTVEGKTLKLNGAGLRKKYLFKVYVAALYVETPSKDGAAVIGSSEVKSMRLSILRTLKGTQVTEAISQGFEHHAKAQLPQLRSRLDRLEKMIPAVKEGDEIVFNWVPEKGVAVIVRGAEKGIIEGRDFGEALLSVWLGPGPVQDDLKAKLLGS